MRNEKIVINKNIPFNMISKEFPEEQSRIIVELTKIYNYYKIYKVGNKFEIEGTNGDYVASNLVVKKVASLINKQSRFMFSEKPDIVVSFRGGTDKPENIKQITKHQELLNEILEHNNFEDILIKGFKDCLIGKRVACLVNWNNEEGVMLSFIKSTNFIYSIKNSRGELDKFVCFTNMNEKDKSIDKRIFKKKYWIDEYNKVHLSESIYNGNGELVEILIEDEELEIDFIPVVLFLNDGLTGEFDGYSEVENLMESESWYNKLSNADMDSSRKNMNAIKYTNDMDVNSTKNLTTGPGSFWDLQTDQNLEKPNPMVGLIESSMNYVDALEKTLNRIEEDMHSTVDVPNITLDNMTGVIASRKGLEAVYWNLIIRCKEKMKVWGPGLRQLILMIFKGSYIYKDCISRYTNNSIIPLELEISIIHNIPLPANETEEKQNDILEVQAKVMSRKSYMMKWRELSEEEVEKELIQIAKERQYLEEVEFMEPTFK